MIYSGVIDCVEVAALRALPGNPNVQILMVGAIDCGNDYGIAYGVVSPIDPEYYPFTMRYGREDGMVLWEMQTDQGLAATLALTMVSEIINGDILDPHSEKRSADRTGEYIEIIGGNFVGVRGTIAGLSCSEPLYWCVHPDDPNADALIIPDELVRRVPGT